MHRFSCFFLLFSLPLAACGTSPSTDDSSSSGGNASGNAGTAGSSGGSSSGGSAGSTTNGVRAVETAGGRDFTCALTSDGAVRCWGYGENGELGDGNGRQGFIEQAEIPASRPPLELGGRAKQLSAGAHHACALLEDSTLRCWGQATFGAIGYGQNTNDIGDDETPAEAGPIAMGAPVVAVSSRYEASCALLEGGAVKCWGYNFEGELLSDETPSIGDHELLSDVPAIPLPAPAERVSMGYKFACAVLEGGLDVACWGLNSFGQLGVEADEVIAAMPVVHTLPERAKDLVTGGSHACVLFDSGDVLCWGANSQGAAGFGDGGSRTIAERLAEGPIPVGGTVVELACGITHTCALLEGGTVRCWGSNVDGAIGYPGWLSFGASPSSDGPPMDVNIGDKVTALSAQEASTCAVLQSGALRCWGHNGNGQLGYGTTGDIGDDETPASAGNVRLLP